MTRSVPDPDEPALEPGFSLGGFCLGVPLGGTEAPAFLARHERLGYPVVIKFLANPVPELAALHMERMARVQSANIPALVDWGTLTHGGQIRTYAVLEYASGQTLASQLYRRGTLSEPEIISLGIQILDGLEAAHRVGIIHGALQPREVFLVPDALSDHVLLLGYYGGAEARASAASGTRTLSNPAYMAPEVLAGGQRGVAQDVFAVGRILRRCLVGSDRRMDRLDGEDALSDLGRVLARATDTTPSRRYGSAREFTLQLRSLACQLQRADERATDGAHGVADVGESRVRPLIWVLLGDPAMERGPIRDALKRLEGRYRVLYLRARDRSEGELLGSSQGERPWVVLFSELHVMLKDSALEVTRAQGETMRLLVSNKLAPDQLAAAVNASGVDGDLPASAGTTEAIATIDRLVERAQRARASYDVLRFAERESSEGQDG